MCNELPVQVRCMIPDARGWCTGMTQRDGMGREEGGEFRMGNTCTPVADSCWCMAKPIQYCKVISLQLNKFLYIKKKNFPQLAVIHTVKGFRVVNEADVLSGTLACSMIHWMLAIWSLLALPFLNSDCTSGSSQFTHCWSLAWRILNIILLARERSTIVW